MKTNRTILGTLALLAFAAAHAPAALAGGPLLSGYGGPGAGAQTIIGATLLNGLGGGSGGNSGGGSGSGSSSPSSSTTTDPSPASPRSTGAIGESGGGQAAGRGSDERGRGAVGGAAGRSAGSSDAYSSSSPHGASAAASVSAGVSWFSDGDLLALVLVAGVLALTAVATLRLARTQHHG